MLVRMLTRQAVKKHQAVTGNDIEGKWGISEGESDKSNIEGGDLVIKWEDCAAVKEEISHEEGGNDEIIKAPSVPAAQSVNKYDAALNWIDNIDPQYWQCMSVLQYKNNGQDPQHHTDEGDQVNQRGKVYQGQ